MDFALLLPSISSCDAMAVAAKPLNNVELHFSSVGDVTLLNVRCRPDAGIISGCLRTCRLTFVSKTLLRSRGGNGIGFKFSISLLPMNFCVSLC